MPRTKPTRSPLGTIFVRDRIVKGKMRKVWDVRRRYPLTNPDGTFKLDAKGNRIYKDIFRRCYSKAEANLALGNLGTEIQEKEAKRLSEETKQIEQSYTFSELVEKFRESEVKPAVFVGGRKVAGYKQDLSYLNFILDQMTSFFKEKPLKEITYEDLKSFRTWLAEQKTFKDTLPTLSTVNRTMSQLRRLLSFAIQIYWLNVSPFKRGPSLIDKAGENIRNRMLTFEEESALLQACEMEYKDVKYKRKPRKNSKFGDEKRETKGKVKLRRRHLIPIILCALDTAMRRAEIFNLEWWQVDFTNKVIYLTKQAAEKTKTGVEGILPLSDRLHKVLSELYDNQPPDTKVFKKFDYKRSFASACEDAGITDLQFRDLRSTAATRLLLAGVSEAHVIKVTRHTRTKTLFKHYVNVDRQIAQDIGEKLNKFLSEKQPTGSD